MELFARFNQVGVSVLIASHDLDLIQQMGSPVVSLSNGRLERDDLATARVATGTGDADGQS
jgi:cell division transport system ATP-binding protein